MTASLGGWAAIVIAAFWGVLVVVLGVVFIGLFRVLESMKMTLDETRQEIVPLLAEVKTTVSGVNREMDRVDTVLDSASKIAKNAERISSVVEQAVSSPLIKVIAFGAGASRAARRLRKKKEK